MVQSLLIANRGEIACRIIRTCREMGIRTIAIFSDADRFAQHVDLADEAVRLGPPPARDSYLNVEAILAAAHETGADAIHPGYGFLSENADFAEAVEAAGLIWVGPAPDTIREMGLKDRAKAIAETAGVPVLPGYRGDDQSADTLTQAAEGIGYPVLIKAVAGGGGRGIREVRSARELPAQLESAVREAESAFGDGRVMLEKLIEQPRHIEVQIFGDGKGEVVHLFERDCSLQRRRQKVVEEAPAPGMSEAVREAMCGAAVALAKAVTYRGAGTVEFIVDGAKPLGRDTFFFLEMNTRLQVEHPVTERVTGTDLVRWQIEIARGNGLPRRQDAIALCGHAIEARICAEDPDEDFRPGAGRVIRFGPRKARDWLRWDTGFGAGDRVPPDYDSMLAKLIVSGTDREEAIDRLDEGLALTEMVGVPSNKDFLRELITAPTFRAGDHHVNWIAEYRETSAGEAPPVLPMDHLAPAIDARGFEQPDGFRLNAPARPEGSDMALGTDRDFDSELDLLAAGDAVVAPMPGKLLELRAVPGDTVSRGDTLAVMEAMKMEHSLTAPRDGKVEAVHVAVGDQLAEGDEIVRLSAEDA